MWHRVALSDGGRWPFPLETDSFKGGTEIVPWEIPQAERTRSQIHPSVFLQLLLYLLVINSLGQPSSRCQTLATWAFSLKFLCFTNENDKGGKNSSNNHKI